MFLTKIYAVYDEEQPLIRYVGMTTRELKIRLQAHISTAKSGRCKRPFSLWINSLLTEGRSPQITLLELSYNGPEAEKRWIHSLSNTLNICRGGNGYNKRVTLTEELNSKLGIWTDASIAEAIGCSAATISEIRRGLGIERSNLAHMRKPKPKRENQYIIPNELLVLLGKVPDDEIAKQIGMTKAALRMRRAKLGIAPYKSETYSLKAKSNYAKLTQQMVNEIRLEFSSHIGVIPKGTRITVAKKHGISVHMVDNIRNYVTWKNN